MTPVAPRDVLRSVVAIALVGALVALSIWVLRPFLLAILWAAMIVAATWPIMLGVQRRLGGQRRMAVLVMTLALLLVFVIPLSLAIGTIMSHEPQITHWARTAVNGAQGPAPEWLGGIPLAGSRLVAAWDLYIADGELREHLSPHASGIITWFGLQLGGLGAVIVQILLTVTLSAVFYAKGEYARATVVAFARRVSPDHGESSVRLAGQAVRGVALGVVVTAIIQSVLGGIGLAVAGIPLAAMLTALMFLMAIAQIGVVPVLACAVAWLYIKDDHVWATVLLVWTVIVGTMDNFLRPFLIRRGADLPLLLIFAGVIGGLLAFGLVGIFIGPTVLAVTWKLFTAWVQAEVAGAPPADAGGQLAGATALPVTDAPVAPPGHPARLPHTGDSPSA